MLLHLLKAQATQGLAAMQAAHRDFSPYLVHFTSYTKMAALRELAGQKVIKPAEVNQRFLSCDLECSKVFQAILKSGHLLPKANSDAEGTLPMVCFSEGNLPGLVSHAERYGRFGFVFRKSTLFTSGARPCGYFDKDMYSEIKKRGKAPDAAIHDKRVYSLSNIFIPKCARVANLKAIDFTHEREWRSFETVSLSLAEAFICPHLYFEQTRKWLDASGLLAGKLFDLDMLVEWGA